MNFTITPKGTDTKPSFTVEAETVEAAAAIAVQRLCGKKRGLVALRTTGEPGKSGVFQGYLPYGHNTQTTTGHPFHVA